MSYHIFKDKYVSVRRAHLCWGCGKKHEPGTRMRSITGVEEGVGFYRTWWCDVCDSFMDLPCFSWNEFEDGIEFGGLRNFDEYEPFREQYLKQEEEA